MYKKIKRWYEQGLWTKPMVAQAVAKGILTQDQYEDITGEVWQGNEAEEYVPPVVAELIERSY